MREWNVGDMDPIERAELAGTVANEDKKIACGTASPVEKAQAKERSELLDEETGKTLGQMEDDSRG